MLVHKIGMLDYIGEFEYQRERFTGYSVGNVIVDLRTHFVIIEVMYHQTHKKSVKVVKHGYSIKGGDVFIDDLLDKINKMHI